MTDRPELPLFRWAESARLSFAARGRTHRRAGLAAMSGAIALVALPPVFDPAPRLVWNASPSAPEGLYLVSPGARPRRGTIVIARLPAPARILAASRHYLPADVPLVKPVAAIAGDRVCAAGAMIRINGKPVAERLSRDRRGRRLPRWPGCRTLIEGEVFLLGTRRLDSFDGRYFGPVPGANVVGTARLIWAR